MQSPELEHCYVHGPLGWLKVTANDRGLTNIDFVEEPPKVVEAPNFPHVKEAYRQLTEYFKGERSAFNLPLDPGGTEFQRSVWDELARIPFGTTLSYGELADRLGSPGAQRAVGMANNRNPLPIVVPCHRVIGADGKLVGFGLGVEMKRALLEHEGAPAVAGALGFTFDP